MVIFFVRRPHCVHIFVSETCCIFMFLIVKLIIWFFPRETDFVHGTSWLLIFRSRNILLTDFFLLKLVAFWFLLIVKFIHRFFSTRNWFCSWNLLRPANFCSWNLLHVDFSLFETCTLIFFFSWNWFCSWNLLRVFVHVNLLRADACSWNLLQVDFSLCETCTLIFSPRETDFVHGASYVLIFCSRSLLCADFCLETFRMFIFLYLETDFVQLASGGDFLFVKLVAFWFSSSWKLYIGFFSRETNFIRRISYVLITFLITFDPRTYCGLIFFQFLKLLTYLFFIIMKLIHLFFSSWNWFCSWNFLSVDL